jgi:hypothetical protein
MAGALSSPVAAQGNPVNWTISNSATDPLSNSGPIAPGPNMWTGNLYLWSFCMEDAAGLQTAEFDVVETQGGGLPVAFNPMNGVLNAGTTTSLLLAVGACPRGPVLAGSFVVGADSLLPDIELCLAPSTSTGQNISRTCDFTTYTNGWVGFRKAAAPCGGIDTHCWLPPVAAPDVAGDAGGLVRASPNPFRESTQIFLPARFGSALQVEVLDTAGRRVRRLVPGNAGGDGARVAWDGRDEDGRAVPAGVYFVKVRSPEAESTAKVLRVR